MKEIGKYLYPVISMIIGFMLGVLVIFMDMLELKVAGSYQELFSIIKSKNSYMITLCILPILFFLLGLYFFFYIRSIVILVFLSFVLMTALRPGVNFLHKKFRLPYPLSILLVYSLVVTLLALAIGLIVPPLANELQKLLS